MARISGFTLIEVLVALFVLAVGLLGLAALQAATLRNNHTAYLRSRATHLAGVMADRMRANSLGVLAGSYNNNPVTTSEDCDDESDGDAGAGDTCTPTEMAGYDLVGWATELGQQLPNGVGMVCLDATPVDGTSAAPACDGSGATYAIKVWWDERVPGSADGEDADSTGMASRRFVTSFQP